jgi:hypothetical protein
MKLSHKWKFKNWKIKNQYDCLIEKGWKFLSIKNKYKYTVNALRDVWSYLLVNSIYVLPEEIAFYKSIYIHTYINSFDKRNPCLKPLLGCTNYMHTSKVSVNGSTVGHYAFLMSNKCSFQNCIDIYSRRNLNRINNLLLYLEANYLRLYMTLSQSEHLEPKSNSWGFLVKP